MRLPIEAVVTVDRGGDNLWMRARFSVTNEAESVLTSLGLSTLSECLGFRGGAVVKRARSGRDVVRIDGVGSVPTVYLKRVRGRGWREISHETQMLGRLRELGLPVPRPLFADWTRGAGALVTEGLPVVGTVESLLLGADVEPSRRALLVRRGAGLLRTLHGVGVNHRDFYAGHLLRDGGDQLFLVDFGRAEYHRRGVPRRRRVKDLAALHFSVPLRVVPWEDRWRFLKLYAPGFSASKRRLWMQRVHRRSQLMRRHAERQLARGAPNFHVNK